jgi:ABC-type transport system involved in multi-copper enzyme maturation permease subunit
VLALFISITAVPPEVERRTTYTLFAKPLNRFEFVMGKFLGCCGLLAANLAVIGLIVALMLWNQNQNLTMALLKNLASFFFSYTALIALAVSATLFLPMAVAGLVALGIYFLGSVYGLGQQVAQTASLNVVWRGLGLLVYHFGRIATPRVNLLNTDRPFYEITGASQPQAVAYVLLYSVVVLVLGSVIFSRREL